MRTDNRSRFWNDRYRYTLITRSLLREFDTVPHARAGNDIYFYICFYLLRDNFFFVRSECKFWEFDGIALDSDTTYRYSEAYVMKRMFNIV